MKIYCLISFLRTKLRKSERKAKEKPVFFLFPSGSNFCAALTITAVKLSQNSVNAVTMFCHTMTISGVAAIENSKIIKPFALIADLIRDLLRLRYKLKIPITHHHFFAMF